MGMFKKPTQTTPLPKNNNVLPVRTVDMALLGQQTLAQYCARMIRLSRMYNNMDSLHYYQDLANMVAHETKGLMLGSLLFEARLIAQDPYVFSELEKKSNLQRADLYNGDTVEGLPTVKFKNAPFER